MPGALVLIETESGRTIDVLKGLSEIDAIEEAEVITGEYDIMSVVRDDSQNELSRILLEEIRKIDGIRGTTTHDFISLQEVRKEDVERIRFFEKEY